jgi:hypothetical protein
VPCITFLTAKRASLKLKTRLKQLWFVDLGACQIWQLIKISNWLHWLVGSQYGSYCLTEVRPTPESSQVQKRKRKNQARLERRRARALADKLMTPPAETSATTVRPSAVPLEGAEVVAVPAAASQPSADLVGGLKEGHLYQLLVRKTHNLMNSVPMTTFGLSFIFS